MQRTLPEMLSGSAAIGRGVQSSIQLQQLVRAQQRAVEPPSLAAGSWQEVQVAALAAGTAQAAWHCTWRILNYLMAFYSCSTLHLICSFVWCRWPDKASQGCSAGEC